MMRFAISFPGASQRRGEDWCFYLYVADDYFGSRISDVVEDLKSKFQHPDFSDTYQELTEAFSDHAVAEL